MEKEEKFKFDQRERDLDLYKTLINTMTEKVSETVKLEIEARFQADMDNKSLAQTIAQKLMNEIDQIKRDVDKNIKETKDTLKDNNHECSDRAHNLSKYIDQQVSGNNEHLVKKYENIKTLLSKLTDQLKSHIVFHDDQLKNIQGRFKMDGDHSSNLKDELFNYTTGIEDRFQKKFKELGNYLETTWKANITVINERVDQLANKADKNFIVLTQELVDTRKVFANRIDEIDNIQNLQFKTVVEDLENLSAKDKNFEILFGKFEKDNLNLNKKIEMNIADIVGKINIWQTNDKVAKNVAHQELIGEIEKVRDDLIQFSQHVQQNMQDLMKNFEITYLSLFEKSKETIEQMNKMSENNFAVFSEFDKNVESLTDQTNKTEINNLMMSMLGKVEELNIIEFIDSVKKDNLQLSDNLNSKIEILENQLKEIEIKNIMDDMINKVEKSSIENQLQNSGNEENEKQLISNISKLDKKLKESDKNIEELKKEIHDIANNMNNNINKKLSGMKNDDNDDDNNKQNILFQQIESKMVVDEILTKLEIDNIYSLLKNIQTDDSSNDIASKLNLFTDRLTKIDKEFTETTNTTKKVLNEYNSVIDSKVNSVMEKLKKENLDMWTNSLEISKKVSTPDDIKKILKNIPPVIIPRAESKKMIKELESTIEQNPRPKLINPWGKIINYKQDFQYDVLNRIKDGGEEEVKNELEKKKVNDKKKENMGKKPYKDDLEEEDGKLELGKKKGDKGKKDGKDEKKDDDKTDKAKKEDEEEKEDKIPKRKDKKDKEAKPDENVDGQKDKADKKEDDKKKPDKKEDEKNKPDKKEDEKKDPKIKDESKKEENLKSDEKNKKEQKDFPNKNEVSKPKKDKKVKEDE